MNYHSLYEAYDSSMLNRVGREMNIMMPDEANKCGSGDKGDHHHDYLDYYEYLLRSFDDKSFSLLEIGINKGYSLLTWLRRYPNVRVTGIDIDLTNWDQSKNHFKITNTERRRLNIIEADATKPEIIDSLSDNFDVILDDGSHITADMIASFEILFPQKLKSRGIYIVEDVHCDGQMIAFVTYAQSLMPFVYKSPSWDECRMLSGASSIRTKIKEDWRYSIKEIIIHRDIVIFTKE
jgi:predicted O-methyltransferase YrrM